jgi:hypothetical protein
VVLILWCGADNVECLFPVLACDEVWWWLLVKLLATRIPDSKLK